ncbi:hypothetical protein MMF93_28080 [Streptomyces tubbatahanensis]|uniref:Lipoprotein n=1 Tax=Streptomyces tubbatahanensis TaxID=2923272 RepID=A0ABY3Y009_9ACTN|nr:hypothetical protein [Streptomyces tubbatahanensis]UNS99883.1 hypothetical protein MMF93_28080 [Streptomyces tubbatahanensis]
MRARVDHRRTPALLVTSLLLVAGCGAHASSEQSAPEVAVLRTGTPVHEPVWSGEEKALVALADGSRQVVRIDPPRELAGNAPRTAHTTRSRTFSQLGRNLALPPGDDASGEAYVALPDRDRIAALNVSDMRTVETREAGDAPSYLATDTGPDLALALSADGSTVSGTALGGKPGGAEDVVTSRRVGLGPTGEIDGPDRGQQVEYYAAAPDRLTHYKGSRSDVRETGSLPLRAEKTTGDKTKVSRLYVAERGSDRLLAVDEKRSGKGLHVVASRHMGQPVRHVDADERRLYAVTDSRLVVLATHSFTGFQDGTFDVVDTVDYRSALDRPEVRKAPVSGIAVGGDRVYLTLEGAPYTLSIAKPSL